LLGNGREERGPLLELRGIVKRFPGVVAVDHADMDLFSNEIHALLGENGAGKSTLMSIASGLYRPDEGTIFFEGRPLKAGSPKEALSHGIAMVHQHFMLVPTLTVAENVVLGLQEQPFFMRPSKLYETVATFAERHGLAVPAGAPVWQLSVGEQQRVEILRALYRGARLLILDEPTSVLTPQEVAQLGTILERLRQAGTGIVLITHKLSEVLALADRVTVMRRGRVVVHGLPSGTTDAPALARLMVGASPTNESERNSSAQGPNSVTTTSPPLAQDVTLRAGSLEQPEPSHTMPPSVSPSEVLVASSLSAMGDRGALALEDVTLRVNAGEIVGVAGVAGNGQRELCEVLAGLRPLVSGSVRIHGRELAGRGTQAFLAAGVAYVPEDRSSAIAPRLGVACNLVLKAARLPEYRRCPFLDQGRLHALAERLIAAYGIATPTLDTPAAALSGGNIQRLILARELMLRPSLLIVGSPTRGLDIVATKATHEVLREEARRGTAILLVSADLEEIKALSTRILVMYRGRIVADVSPAASLEDIGCFMAGVAPPHAEGAPCA